MANSEQEPKELPKIIIKGSENPKPKVTPKPKGTQ